MNMPLERYIELEIESRTRYMREQMDNLSAQVSALALALAAHVEVSTPAEPEPAEEMAEAVAELDAEAADEIAAEAEEAEPDEEAIEEAVLETAELVASEAAMDSNPERLHMLVRPLRGRADGHTLTRAIERNLRMSFAIVCFHDGVQHFAKDGELTGRNPANKPAEDEAADLSIVALPGGNGETVNPPDGALIVDDEKEAAAVCAEIQANDPGHSWYARETDAAPITEASAAE